MQVDACPWSPFGVQDLLGSWSAGKNCGAGKAQDSEIPVKNGAQEPHPVWHFKNIKERGVGGEVVRASVPLGESLALYPGRCPKRCQCFSCVESVAAHAQPPLPTNGEC